jgi:signal transduction histidine kinase
MQQFAKMIHEEAFELDFQLKNIFAAAKLEAGEYSPSLSQVDIVALFNNTIDIYANMCSRKNVAVKLVYYNNSTIREQELFKTDPDKLNLIISNLLNNSIRFSPENNDIKIHLTLNDDFIHFTIRDNGMGIDKNQVNKIFDRFYRTDNSINSENKGLGLGLSITKGILEMMGGNITVKETNRGSEFMVTLPEDRTNEVVDNLSASGNEFFFDEENQIF